MNWKANVVCMYEWSMNHESFVQAKATAGTAVVSGGKPKKLSKHITPKGASAAAAATAKVCMLPQFMYVDSVDTYLKH